jgi:hypothetical protein
VLSLLNKNLSGCVVSMLGCGPFPETLIDMYKSNCHINMAIGIEKRASVAMLANKVISEIFPKTEKIRVLSADAELFDYSRVDIIFLANGLIGKNDILRRIYKTAPAKANILVRNPILMGNILYEDILETQAIKSFEILGSVKASKLSETLLLKKISDDE